MLEKIDHLVQIRENTASPKHRKFSSNNLSKHSQLGRLKMDPIVQQRLRTSDSQAMDDLCDSGQGIFSYTARVDQKGAGMFLNIED